MLLVFGCADPRPPAGGPADKTPPELEMSVPENEAVNVTLAEIRLVFTEYVDQSSFVQAFSITPALDGRLRFRWRKRTVSIRLPGMLRDSTTYLITLDTRLRDMRGVNLRRPLTIAFATGPEIDRGRLRGRLVEPVRGNPVSGYDVFAYPASDLAQGWPENPAYRTQTGEDGQFDLSHVREIEYFVVALQDLNRNQHPDAAESYATPPEQTILAVPDTLALRKHWIISSLDTIAPRIDRTRALSKSRVAARFSEAVLMPSRNPEAWVLSDSITGTQVGVQEVYALPHEPWAVYLRTDELDERTYKLVPDAQLADSSGNMLAVDTIYFAGRNRPDTTLVRFQGFLPADNSDLGPHDVPSIMFNQVVSDSLFQVLVSASDTSGNPLALTSTTHNGTVYKLILPLARGKAAVVRVTQPDSLHERRFRRLSDRELGTLSGIAMPAGDSIVIALHRAEESQTMVQSHPDSAGRFVFHDLPEDAYMIRMFADSNGNGKWDGGQLVPFVPAEPITWFPDVIRARPRWDTALGDTLHLYPELAASPELTVH